jgi:hypothetical protein
MAQFGAFTQAGIGIGLPSFSPPMAPTFKIVGLVAFVIGLQLSIDWVKSKRRR